MARRRPWNCSAPSTPPPACPPSWRATWGRRSRRSSARWTPAPWWSARCRRSSSRTRRIFAPECALLLNIAEDHLDRHGSFEAYREAKLSIFSRQGPDDLAIAPADMDVAKDVSFGGPGADLALDGGALLWRGEHLIGADEIRLRGAHNLENAMGASAAALATGIEPGAVRRGAARVRRPAAPPGGAGDGHGVLYVDDSKATNVAAATRGIESFDGGVHAILGGSLKGGGFTGLRSAVSARCRVCYLIGEAADRLAGDLEGTVPLVRSGDLETAVHEAAAAAQPGGGGAAVTRVRGVRPLPRLRPSRRALPGAGAQRMNPGRSVEDGLDGRRPDPSQATPGVLAPLHGDALPVRGRRGHGLLGELGGVAAPRPRRPVLLPQALPLLRSDRAGGAAPALAARARGGQDSHAAASGGGVLPDAVGDGPRRRGVGQRGHPLARSGTAPVPALGAAQAGAGPLRRAATGGAAARDEDAGRASPSRCCS